MNNIDMINVIDKPTMLDFEYNNTFSYLINTVFCLFLPILLIPVLFIADILFLLSFIFALVIVLYISTAFFKTRLYATVFDKYMFSRQHFWIDLYMFVIVVTLSIIIMVTEYLIGLYLNTTVLNSVYWIMLKVIVLILAFVFGFVMCGINYEKTRKRLKNENIIRKTLKNSNHINDLYNTRGYIGNRIQNILELKTSALYMCMRCCMLAFQLTLTPLLLVSLILLNQPLTIIIFLFLYTIGVFIMYLLYAKKYQQKPKQQLLEILWFIISCILTVVIVVVNHLTNNAIITINNLIYWTIKIIVIAIVIFLEILLLKRVLYYKQKCMEEKINYQE